MTRIVHSMFEVQQSHEQYRSETATISGVNVSHVYLLPLGEFATSPAEAVDRWREFVQSYLTVVLRVGGKQEISGDLGFPDAAAGGVRDLPPITVPLVT